ncbi:MAG: hypothetical protein LAO78_24975 [Acidobacteriia bacterium]|nr:hypothetical protein [Terriglobia bacterium]
MKRKIQNLSFAVIAVAVLCAGTVSAAQLRSGVNGFTCGGSCSATQPCPTSNCVCSFTTPTTAFCTTKLAGAVPSGK